MTTHDPLCGALVVNKPSGPTSHDIVARVRVLSRTKVGHTGTLDPLASGVLPLLLGPATRLTRFFQSSDKEYLAEIQLGQTTDTLDGEGEVLQKRPVPEVSPLQADQVLSKFTGEIRQQPPMFSAVKVGGKKLYQLARQKREVERPWREVTIHRLELLRQEREIWSLHVHCSAGTYIRTLAHDIGEALGCGAYLRKLQRTRSGCFDLSQALPLEGIENQWRENLYPMEELLPELPRIDLNEPEAVRVRHGNGIFRSGTTQEKFFRLFHQQKLLAIGQSGPADQLRPVIVLRSAQPEEGR
ncbi:MAG: tRNA pseudouridine(55) synthase TruB [Acidobacteria bacterium]|nr:tRNA pseudouridine(55) synthase TruB [Acidobacteriota bacterium]TDI08974.1 MAG: tRNA pseudouridine(55) synthase TruB [Acidobacteriota bacterium]